jgi:hypothetical protein
MIESIHHQTGHGIRIICQVLEVPRSSYYHASRPTSTQGSDLAIGLEIEIIFKHHRRHLLVLGAGPTKVNRAMRSRKGYWRMSQNEIVRFALNNRWLEEQGVPNMKDVWIGLHYGAEALS